jgi:hypothetical protein
VLRAMLDAYEQIGMNASGRIARVDTDGARIEEPQ